MGATASRPSATAPRGRRPAGRPRRPPLPLPAGAVRASSIFPILSVTLLFFGGLCVAASELHRSRYNVILSAGIFFVSAGGCHPPPALSSAWAPGPAGATGTGGCCVGDQPGGPAERGMKQGGARGGARACARGGLWWCPPPRPSAVRAPANSGSRLPECSIPHVTHGISGSKAETGRPTRSGGRPMTALTRRRPGSQGGQRRSSRRGPLLPPSIAAPPPLASSWSLSPEAPSLLHLLLPCARSAAGVGLGTSRWDSTVRRWPRALPGRGGIFAGTGTEGEDRAVGERGPPAWVWVPAAPGASSLRLGRLGCGLGPSDGTCFAGPRSPCPRPHASPSVKRGGWPHPALRLQEPTPATDQGESRHGVPPQRAVAPDLTLGGPTRGPARLRGLFASPAA